MKILAVTKNSDGLPCHEFTERFLVCVPASHGAPSPESAMIKKFRSAHQIHSPNCTDN